MTPAHAILAESLRPLITYQPQPYGVLILCAQPGEGYWRLCRAKEALKLAACLLVAAQHASRQDFALRLVHSQMVH